MNPTTPLSEVRAHVLANRDEGVHCPACDQYAKTYTRRLHSTIARALIVLYWEGGSMDYVHGPSMPGDTHELSTAARWGLIEEETILQRPDGGRAGFWRLTNLGVRFVRHGASIREYVDLYNNEVIGFSGDDVMITQCLGNKFDYTELMTKAASA